MKKLVSLIMVTVMLLSFGNGVCADNEVYNSQVRQNSVDFIWPTQSKRITSPYGWRTHPITGERNFHTGVDIGRITDSDPVWSAAEGVVVFKGSYGNYGKIVVINSEWDGIIIQTRYAHLDSINKLKNKTVMQGTRIGTMGATGNVTGIHLHYEVRQVDNINSIWTGTTMDPEKFHDFIDNGGEVRKIDEFMSMDNKKDTQVGFSDDGFGLSIGDRFLSLDHILNAPVEKLQSLGLTTKDLSLLIENTIIEINPAQIEKLKKLQKLIAE